MRIRVFGGRGETSFGKRFKRVEGLFEGGFEMDGGCRLKLF